MVGRDVGVHAWQRHDRGQVHPVAGQRGGVRRGIGRVIVLAVLHEARQRPVAGDPDGVVADVRDVDLGMVLGAGWPLHNGGIAPYLDRTGASEATTGRRFLAPGVASLP